jgi:hypothetical protein
MVFTSEGACGIMAFFFGLHCWSLRRTTMRICLFALFFRYLPIAPCIQIFSVVGLLVHDFLSSALHHKIGLGRYILRTGYWFLIRRGLYGFLSPTSAVSVRGQRLTY